MKYAIRSQFIAPKGYVLLAFDLSQAETWCVAHLANEYNMMDALTNGDIHSQTATVLYDKANDCKHQWADVKEGKSCPICGVFVTTIERYAGKQNNHAQSYRMGYLRLAEVFNKNSDKPPYMIVSNNEAKIMSTKWHSYYNLKPWWGDVEERLNRDKRVLTTVYGFRRTFFGQWGDELFKEATAFEPQSTVADHAFGAIHPDLGIAGGILEVSRLCKKLGVARPVHTAYDSIMLEVQKEAVDDIAPQVYRLMHRPLIINRTEFTIPVDGEVGERWGELEKMTHQKLAA